MPLRIARAETEHGAGGQQGFWFTEEDHAVVVARSARMRRILDFIRVVASADGTVLLSGEPGCGKRTLAKEIHRLSPRARKPFLAVDCTLLEQDEAILFGREATKDATGRLGALERANGGTLFLNLVHNAPASTQARLVGVMRDHCVQRLDGDATRPVDVRIMAATTRNLDEMVRAGSFRAGLLDCLGVVSVDVPPLRDRSDDIVALAEHFLARGSRGGKQPPEISGSVLSAFIQYAWPGNVRELEKACEAISQACTCGVVRAGCLPPKIFLGRHRGRAATIHAAPFPVSLSGRLNEVETDLICRALERSQGNKSKAAALLNVKRSTLGDRIKKLGLALAPPGELQ